jgi:hypothetical protein
MIQLLSKKAQENCARSPHLLYERYRTHSSTICFVCPGVNDDLQTSDDKSMKLFTRSFPSPQEFLGADGQPNVGPSCSGVSDIPSPGSEQPEYFRRKDPMKIILD